MFKRVLVANRGEIALRVIRACRELGLASVAVYSDADRDSLHVAAADEAVHIGPTPPLQSYLDIGRILAAAKRTRCDALHPGYGFLAESARFARACAHAGLTFIGPSPEAMERMGDKLSARSVAQDAGVPIVPGTTKPVLELEAAGAIAQSLGYPIAVKASAGGGGKGLKVAQGADQLELAMSLAAKEAAAYFADASIYLEHYLANPKHVEVQVLGDRLGNAVHLGERDCSLQRRHQKLIEETPSCLDSAARLQLHDAALTLARAIGYDSAGTVEFLVEGNKFYFLEMNTRIQVEHTISEAIYGFDLVKAQIRISAGEPLWFSQASLVPRGHAIECRINAEDPSAGFAPRPGRITRYVEPGGPGIRVDGAAFDGWTIVPDYDSLIAKLIAWGGDRSEATQRMSRALLEYSIEGIQTTIPLYRLLLEEPAFREGTYTTSTVEMFAGDNAERLAQQPESPAGCPTPAIAGETLQLVTVNGKQFRVLLSECSRASGVLPPARKYRSSGLVTPGTSAVAAPMHGIVAEIRVAPGQRVESGQIVAVVEAMKMMNEILALTGGTVRAIYVRAGQAIEAGSPLISLEESREPPPGSASGGPPDVPMKG